MVGEIRTRRVHSPGFGVAFRGYWRLSRGEPFHRLDNQNGDPIAYRTREAARTAARAELDDIESAS